MTRALSQAQKVCRVPGCERAAVAKSLCGKHWKRQHDGKDPTQKSFREKTPAERFWEKVDRRGPDECWLWRGGTKGNGIIQYGSAWFAGKNELSHRVAWLLLIGEIPEVPGADRRGTCLLHSCDTPLCVNPKHLTPGTHLQNMQDKVAKKRDIGNKTHCRRGHERTDANIYVDRKGHKHCLTCHRLLAAAARRDAGSSVRRPRLLSFLGEQRTLAAWCSILGLNPKTTHKRIYALHWPVEKALSTPARIKSDVQKENTTWP